VTKKGFALTIAVLTGIPAVLSPPALAAPPAGLCTHADPARPTISQLPWAQQTLDPATVWPYSTGSGVLVAVIDSGVDVDHPQLRARGKVRPGEDFFQVGKLRATFDCDSHGTAVASMIAAAPQPGMGFRGFAPGATILPVRVSERASTDGAANEIDPLVLAQGIRYAADQRAKVINLSMAGHRDDKVVRQAIAYAQSRDALVVAAVGNSQEGDDRSLPRRRRPGHRRQPRLGIAGRFLCRPDGTGRFRGRRRSAGWPQLLQRHELRRSFRGRDGRTRPRGLAAVERLAGG
jgi:hypothetical protein